VAIAGTYLETCNCDPGCGCNFRGFPTSPEGNCEAFLGHAIERGSYDGIDLAGAKAVWALWWPGPIHDKGGRGHAYVDCETDEQFWRDGEIAQSGRMRMDLPEMNWDLSGRHAVFSRFGYSNVSGFEDT
jgi:hypothetical protein